MQNQLEKFTDIELKDLQINNIIETYIIEIEFQRRENNRLKNEIQTLNDLLTEAKKSPKAYVISSEVQTQQALERTEIAPAI
jgi:hypothetical protein